MRIKPDRVDLVGKIIALANLPSGKETAGYLTRGQLSELAMYLEGAQLLIQKLMGNQRTDAEAKT